MPLRREPSRWRRPGLSLPFVHGVIFSSFRDYVAADFGADTAQLLFDAEPIYLLSEAYPDERLVALIGKLAERSGRDVDSIVQDFGVFTARTTFARLYPAFFEIAPSCRDFLLTVEERIHELVRATLPNAAPPELSVVPLDADSLQIVYTSPRRLCVLLRGLAEGTAQHYGETAHLDERTCMHRGDDACRFHVRLERPVLVVLGLPQPAA